VSYSRAARGAQSETEVMGAGSAPAIYPSGDNAAMRTIVDRFVMLLFGAVKMVRTLSEAMQWFLRNHSGSVAMIGKDGTEGSAESYGEAESFFRRHGEPEPYNPAASGIQSVSDLLKST